MQTVWLAREAEAEGCGFTVMVNCIGALAQVVPPLVKEATTLNVLVSGIVSALAAVNAGTLPVPLFTPRPMAWLVRDQLKVAPGTLLLNTTEGTEAPAQYV